MKKIWNQSREPMNCMTHLVGVFLFAIATLIMLLRADEVGASLQTTVSVVVFGISLMALYAASALYHYYPGEHPHTLLWLRKLDHSMIYVLIVGTYTPISLYYLPAGENLLFTGILWAIALVGIIVKLCWMGAPRFLSTLVYLLLGWSVLFDFNSFLSIPTSGLWLIAAGGIAYSIGAVIYIIKKPNLSKYFGFHEIFHLFILLGSFLHVLAVYFYVLV